MARLIASEPIGPLSSPAKPMRKQPEPRSRFVGRKPWHWLQLSEGIAVVGSAVGSVAATISGQIAWAATPLTLAIALNMANRYRQEADLLIQVNQQLSQLQQTLTTSQASSLEVQQLQGEMARLQSTLTQVQDRSQKALTQLQNHVSQELAAMQQLAELFTLPEIEPTLAAQIAAVQASVVQLDRKAAHVINRLFQQLSGEIEGIRAQVAAQPSVNLTAVESAIATVQSDLKALSEQSLQSQLSQIQDQVNEAVHRNREIVKPYLKQLGAAVQQAQSQTAEMESAIADLRSQIYTLSQEFHYRPELAKLQRLQAALDRLEQSVEEIHPSELFFEEELEDVIS